MSTPSIIGDAAGVKLWNMMASSDNAVEQEYFQRLSSAATQTGRVFFSDFVTQLETKQNQTTWKLEWNGKDWEISLFHIPDDVEKISDRISNYVPTS
jgi:hypothetical protein